MKCHTIFFHRNKLDILFVSRGESPSARNNTLLKLAHPPICKGVETRDFVQMRVEEFFVYSSRNLKSISLREYIRYKEVTPTS